jgi:hypothetical protein
MNVLPSTLQSTLVDGDGKVAAWTGMAPAHTMDAAHNQRRVEAAIAVGAEGAVRRGSFIAQPPDCRTLVRSKLQFDFVEGSIHHLISKIAGGLRDAGSRLAVAQGLHLPALRGRLAQ